MSDSSINISVIIPCFNTERYLREAVESVLNQTVTPFEIIIVDDGSTDHSAAIASSYSGHQVSLIRKPQQEGIAATRNVGVQQAKGNYLAFLDADDIWEKTKLEKQIAICKQKPNIHGVFGKTQQFISPHLSAAEKQRFSCTPTPQAGYHAGCLLIARSAFLHVGYFSETLVGGEFIDWYVRAQQLGLVFYMLDDVVMYRRIHGNNTVLRETTNVHNDYLKIIRAKLKSKAV